MDGEAFERPQFLAEELLALEGCLGRKSQFSLGVWPCIDCPYLSGWPLTVRAVLVRLIIKKKEVGMKLRMKMYWRTVGVEITKHITYMFKILQE